MTTLSSPGVNVTVVDESFYTPAAPGTVPLIFIASAANKSNASGTGTAQGTTSANADKVWVITSQRDLTDTFGTPLFYTGTSGSPIHGGELNEYGLQAAYSLLGASSKAYIARADIDLGQLTPTATAPTGQPVAGTYWLDTANSLFGINEWNNAGQGSFTVKTPLIIDNDNYATVTTDGTPKNSFGKQGDYAIYVTSQNMNSLWYKTSTNAWVEVVNNFNGGKLVQVSPHYTYPTWTTATNSGSVWVKTTTPGLGAKWSLKYYNGTTKAWTAVTAPIYSGSPAAINALDSAGGGLNIPVGSIYIDSNVDNAANATADFKIWRRNSTGKTTVVFKASSSNLQASSSFKVRETSGSSGSWGSAITVSLAGSTTTSVASLIPAAISAQASIHHVSAEYDADAGTLTFTHNQGGDFEIADVSNDPLVTAIAQTSAYPGLEAYDPINKTGTPNLYEAPAYDSFSWLVTNWRPLTYVASRTAPISSPANGTLWYNSQVTEVDIMINDGTNWRGYRNFYPATDVNGPTVSATEPTAQSTGSPLVTGDIWVDISDLEMYGQNIYVYNGFTSKWELQDPTDQTSPTGWLFADARWSGAGQDVTPDSTAKLLTYDYVDPDAPDPALYPRGMKLWNLRRSGYNVKKYVSGYIDINANSGANLRYVIDGADLMNTSGNEYFTGRWVTYNGVNEDGTGKFGRHAQRGQVIAAFKSLIDTNPTIRDTDTLVFNLIACPGYPEAISNMVQFNTDIGQTAFIVGDTPFRLEPTGTALTTWGLNTNGAYDNGDDGGVTYDEYLAMFYPSGYTTDNSGNNIVVPASHMMLRTIANSDAKSYQWFAPAGTRRGGVDNASSVGYIDSMTGEFKTASLYQGLRDVLQTPGININPIATLPGVGVVNYGQKTRAKGTSALDRINVARLVAYLRRQLSVLAKPYLFEPNDAQTRREIKAAADSLLLELVGQRALYDFVVVCDTTNNTNARVDRNELWVDIAIEPVKAVEFIYIPLRIKKTGSIAAGQ